MTDICDHTTDLRQQPASVAGVEGWFLPASSINSLQRESVDAQIKRCKAAHYTNLDIRINGQNEAHEADWIKHMVKVAAKQPAVHPAITHCANCGCDWLDNGLNPVGCPYCKQHNAPGESESNYPTKYYKQGSVIYAVHGTSSINCVERLLAKIADLENELENERTLRTAALDTVHVAREGRDALREVLSKILENEASDYKTAEAFGGYVLDDELREEARAMLAKWGQS